MRNALNLLGAVCLAAAIGLPGAATAKTFVYVSNAQDGNIDAYSMDTNTGVLTSIEKMEAGKLVMPLAVSPSKKFLYAVVRSQPFRVLTFGITPATGKLIPEASGSLPDSMAYGATDRSGRFFFTASYGGDKVAVNTIQPNGFSQGSEIQIVATGKNAHAILPDHTNKFVYATNLGSDQIQQFKFDAKSGQLTPNEPAVVKTRPGYGPRHLAFSPDNKFLYCLTELTGAVIQYAIDPAKGTLKEVDVIGTVPAESGLVPGVALAPLSPTAVAAPAAAKPAGSDKPKIWAADVQISPNGKFLYTTERTSSKIAMFKVTAGTGKLVYVGNIATEKQPRGIKVDPSGKFLVASGEQSNKLAIYKIDQTTGALTQVSTAPVGQGANWVEIVDVP